MKTIHLLSISAAVALTTLAFSVGCSPAPVQSFEPDDDDDDTGKGKKKGKDDDEDDEKTSSSGKKTTSSSQKGGNQNGSSSSGGAPPRGEPPGGEIPGGGPPPGEDEAEACFQQCISGNPAAQQIDAQLLACFDNCGRQDQQCGEACFDQVGPACQQNPAACQLLDKCDQQCFGDLP